MNIVDWILFTLLGLCVCYLLLYAIASKFYRAPHFPEARTFRRFVVFFPAYKGRPCYCVLRAQFPRAGLSTGIIRRHRYFRPNAICNQ